MKTDRLTLSDVASLPGDRDLLFCQFLDDFRHEPSTTCLRLLVSEPAPTGDDRFDAKLAAAAELLSNRRGITPPKWVFYPGRYLSERYYMAERVCAKDPAARKWFEDTTPEEFSSRNLFCGPDPLARC